MLTTSVARSTNRTTVLVSMLAGASALLLGCASGGAAPHPVRSSVHVEPSTAMQAGAMLEPAAPPALPALGAGTGPALSAAPQRRIREVNVPAGTSIAAAVSKLGADYGLNVSIDPDVRGTTQANLRNVTLDEALNHLVTRNGFRYQLQGTVLRVVPQRMESRTFPLDYVALSRIGSMSTIVQRRLSSSNGGLNPGTATGFSTASAGGGGGDVLTGQSVADIWLDIKVALSGIMGAGLVTQTVNSAGTATAVPIPTAPSQAAQAASGNGPTASSTSFADGSVLIISPTSGLINVTAMPEKLAAVEKFLNEFQASVLRQVMISAKIVEVNLNKSFEFGIDWNVVSATTSNRFGLTLRSDPSTVTTGNTGNVNFTFTGGNTTINAVVTALQSQGTVSVLSNEQTSALNNQRAIFQVTTDEVFFSVSRSPLLGPTGAVVSTQTAITQQQISVGVVLDVLAQISADNILTMNIRPAITNIDHTASITVDGATASAPVIARREGDTMAHMRGGETMMIGGLVQTRKERKVSGIPFLMDVPLIGKAFQHITETETRSELVVFLTPTIISGQPAAGR